MIDDSLEAVDITVDRNSFRWQQERGDALAVLG
jgi:hypothetical protein